MEMTEKTFGIISEGVTDQIVLKNILIGFTGDKDLFVNPLQPKEGETGNWDKVFKYCQSNDFKGALGFYDFVIIQIDTDFMHRGEVPENYQLNLKDLNEEQIVEAFKQKLIELIGQDFYNEYQNQIIFAIAVNEIECWFLPVYFPTKSAKYSKTINCIDTLNEVLPKTEGFYINNKAPEYYRKMSKHFLKKKDLKEFSSKKFSFSAFINQLETKLHIFT
jgi:hypothetical protein